jgi:CheY-like chemotaxis protein
MSYVLVVDDEEDIRDTVAMGLALEGLAVQVAKDTIEAWRQICARAPSCVLLDIQMPGEDGIAFLQRLRANRDTHNIPVFFMTAQARAETAHRCRALGAEGFFLKPLDLGDVVRQMRGRNFGGDKDVWAS